MTILAAWLLSNLFILVSAIITGFIMGRVEARRARKPLKRLDFYTVPELPEHWHN